MTYTDTITNVSWYEVLLTHQTPEKPSFDIVDGYELVVREDQGFVFELMEGRQLSIHPDAAGEPWQIIGPLDAYAIRRPFTGGKSCIDAVRQENGRWTINLFVGKDDNGRQLNDGARTAFQRAKDEIHRPVRPLKRRDLSRLARR